MFKSIINLFKKDVTKSVHKEIKNNLKGQIGEFKQEIKFSVLLKQEYKIINDFILPRKDKTTQIDHFIISKFGLFVIESKNFSGSIYGNENSDNWTYYLANKKYNFYNPVKQNLAHIKAIKDVIGDKYPIYSIINFSSKTKLAKIDVSNKNTIIINEQDLISSITSFKDIVISESDMDIIYKSILKTMSTVNQSTFEHTKNVKNNIKEKKNKSNSSICPKCSSVLTEKNGKYGKFISCSSYPKCRYTEKL